MARIIAARGILQSFSQLIAFRPCASAGANHNGVDGRREGMKLLMDPGVTLMNRLSTPQKMLLTVAAFSLSLAAALLVLAGQGASVWQDPAVHLIGAAYLLALYSTLGHHLQVKTGFAGL